MGYATAPGRRGAALALAFGSVLAYSQNALGNDRHFTFTQESATLPAGSFEIEPRVTVHGGRRQSYAALDYRLEFEGGLTDRLQGSLYFNGAFGPDGGGPPANASLEFKYRVLDSVADPVGLALYVEATGGPDLAELEARIIVDRRIGRVILAGNLLGEYDWFFLAGETRQVMELQATLAAAYQFTPSFTAGLEVWSYNRFSMSPEVLTEVASVYAGPSLSYAWRNVWVALSVMPQLGAVRMASPRDFRNVDTADAVYARLVTGLHW